MILLFFSFEIGFPYVALAALELNMKTRMASNSQIPACFCLLSAKDKGMHRYVWIYLVF